MGTGTLSGTLRQCPCGETPDAIGVQDAGQGGKYALAAPNCCGEWLIEFRTNYEAGETLRALAEKAWNEAPSGKWR